MSLSLIISLTIMINIISRGALYFTPEKCLECLLQLYCKYNIIINLY